MNVRNIVCCTGIVLMALPGAADVQRDSTKAEKKWVEIVKPELV